MSTLTTTIRAENRFSGTMQQLAAEAVQIRRAVVDGNKQAAQSYEAFGKTLSAVAENTRKSWAEITVGIKSAVDLAGEALRRFQDVYRQFARFEDAATRLAPLVGGLETAKNLCRSLRDEAANGTMSFEQLAGVAGKLAAVFKNSGDIKKWTTIFHNISAGTGLDINELIGNFTKLKAAGRVTGEFPEMFAQKGVNIFGELEKQTGKSAAELRKMATAGTLSFSEIETALEAVATGTGRFAGQAAAMSNTFGGSVGTMMANLDILKAELSAPIAERLTPTIQQLAVFIRKCADSGETIGDTVFTLAKIGAPILAAVVAFKSLNGGISLSKSLFGGLFSFVKSGFAQMTADAGKAAAATASVGNATATAGGKFAGFARVAGGIGAIVGIAADLGLALYLSHIEDCTAAAEKLLLTQKRLQESMRKMDDAKTAEDFDAARKNAEALSDLLAEKQTVWKEEAGMTPTAWNADVFRESIDSLRERKELEWEEARAAAATAEAQAKKAEAFEAAQTEWQKFNREQDEQALKAEVENASIEELPGVLLRQGGFDSADSLRQELASQKKTLDFALAWGEATAEQVADYRRIVELLEKVNAAEKKLDAHTQEQQTRRDAAAKAYERQKALLEAEIAGNDEAVGKIRSDERYDALVSQFIGAGMDEVAAARAAQEISDLEAKKAALEKEKPAGTDKGFGSGLVSSGQAGVGGGRSIQIGGGDGLIGISRRQLDMLSRIEKNTASVPEFNAAPVLA